MQVRQKLYIKAMPDRFTALRCICLLVTLS
jgi:hypothetical protein